MTVKEFVELFVNYDIQRFEVWLDKEFIFSGYISDIPSEKRDIILNAEFRSVDEVVNDTIVLNCVGKEQ